MLPQSGGVVRRDKDYRRMSRLRRIREYFYGERGEFVPHQSGTRTQDIVMCRVGSGPKAPRSALPIGAEVLQVS